MHTEPIISADHALEMLKTEINNISKQQKDSEIFLWKNEKKH